MDQSTLQDLIARLDRGIALIEAAQARGDEAEADRLLAHWRRLDEQYRRAYEATTDR